MRIRFLYPFDPSREFRVREADRLLLCSETQAVTRFSPLAGFCRNVAQKKQALSKMGQLLESEISGDERREELNTIVPEPHLSPNIERGPSDNTKIL